MKTLILIADKSLSFDLLKDEIGKHFQCSQVLDNRLTVESDADHLFIDFDDDIKDDYEEPEIKNSDNHFFAVLYNTDDFARNVLKELSKYQIQVDDDEGIILSLQVFLNQGD